MSEDVVVKHEVYREEARSGLSVYEWRLEEGPNKGVLVRYRKKREEWCIALDATAPSGRIYLNATALEHAGVKVTVR